MNASTFLPRFVVVLCVYASLDQGILTASTFAPALHESKHRPRSHSGTTDLTGLQRQTQNGRTYVQIDDMRFLVSEGPADSGFNGNLWTNGTVYYVFDSAVSTANRQAWRNAAGEWYAAAALKFNEGYGAGNYIYVQNSTSNSSWVGMIGGEQEMDIANWESKYIIAHEIGHALGQIHEQSRSDRDSYVTIAWHNIESDQEYNFYKESSINYGRYDFDSVMHYGQCGFSTCSFCSSSCRTIIVKAPYTNWQGAIGQLNHLSELDRDGMAKRYGARRYDVNLDGSADFVIYQPSSRRAAIWFLNGRQFASGANVETLIPSGYRIVDTADFNVDRKPDLLLFNPSTGKSVIWFLDGAIRTGGAFGPSIGGGYVLVGAADFDRNGRPDYLLYNSSTHRVAVSYLNGTKFSRFVLGPIVTGAYQPVATGDFNRDGSPDLALFNPGNRRTEIWYLNGVSRTATIAGPTISAGYVLAGVATFPGDGNPDFLLFNPSTRRTAISYGARFNSGAFGPTLPASYTLVAP